MIYSKKEQLKNNNQETLNSKENTDEFITEKIILPSNTRNLLKSFLAAIVSSHQKPYDDTPYKRQ